MCCASLPLQLQYRFWYKSVNSVGISQHSDKSNNLLISLGSVVCTKPSNKSDSDSGSDRLPLTVVSVSVSVSVSTS